MCGGSLIRHSVIEVYPYFSSGWYQQIEQQKQEQLALLKQIEEERARLEAEFLKIQMQTCLEATQKKRDEEEPGQLMQSHCVPSTHQQNKVEHEVKSCRKLF